jgi:hypothetical protein
MDRDSPAGTLVGAVGFEPTTSCSQSTRAAKLRHAPTADLPGEPYTTGECAGTGTSPG